MASDPDVILGGARAAFMSGIEHAARLDQQQLDLAFRTGLVLDAARHHEHFARRQMHRAVAEIDAQIALDDDERFVRILVIVPDEVALQLDDLEVIVVHFGDDLWLPLLVEQRELLAQVDRLVAHRVAPSSIASLTEAPAKNDSSSDDSSS